MLRPASAAALAWMQSRQHLHDEQIPEAPLHAAFYSTEGSFRRKGFRYLTPSLRGVAQTQVATLKSFLFCGCVRKVHLFAARILHEFGFGFGTVQQP